MTRRARAGLWVHWSLVDRVYVAYSCLVMQVLSAHEFARQECEPTELFDPNDEITFPLALAIDLGQLLA